MNKGDKAEKRIIKDSLFPISLFAIYLGVLLLMSGIHQGLVVLMNTLELNGFIQTLIPTIYWTAVAAALSRPLFLPFTGLLWRQGSLFLQGRK